MAGLVGQANDPGLPVGQWFQDAVFWVATELDGPVGKITGVVHWSVERLIAHPTGGSDLTTISWLWVAGAALLIGLLTRRPRNGIKAMLALTLCASLGGEYWGETAETLGLIILTLLYALVLAAPIALIGHRSPAVATSTRRALDTFQFAHPFMLMLPAIFMFGIGAAASILIAAAFPAPPLIRRLIPADPASSPIGRRLAAGLSEAMVLAFWIIGIASLMGAGGMGRLLFRAINNLNVELAGVAGISMIALGYALDQLLRDVGGPAPIPRYDAPHDPSISRPALGAGAAVAVASLFLPWSDSTGRVSAYVSAADVDRAGEQFGGLHPAGGSAFGIVVLAVGLLTLLSVVGERSTPMRLRVPPAPVVVVGGVSVTVVSAAFLWSRPVSGDFTWAWGPALAAFAGLLIAASAVRADLGRATPESRSLGVIAFAGLAFAIVVAAVSASWLVDARPDRLLSPALQAELDELNAAHAEAEAEDDVGRQLAVGQEITNFWNRAAQDPFRATGLDAAGPRLGLPTVVAAGAAVAALLAGLFGRRRLLPFARGLAIGAALVPACWILSTYRAADTSSVYAGAGSLVAALGAAALARSLSVGTRSDQLDRAGSAAHAVDVHADAAAEDPGLLHDDLNR